MEPLHTRGAYPGFARHGTRKHPSALRRAAIETLESRRLLTTTAINPNEAIPFQQIIIDPNPGNTPVVKLLVDITNNGKEDAVVGHETNTGGDGLDWYQYPASGNPNDPWIEHSIDPTADVYESARAANISGNVDSNGNPVMDLVVSERGSMYWYENPLGLGENPATAPWPKFLIGTIPQGVTHELYLADLEGAGHLDVISNDAIFLPNYTPGQSAPTSWTEIATPNFDRTEKGLYLFNSGSGLGDVDLLGTGNAPNFQVGWWENPRDTGGNLRTGTWTFHAIGPAYGNYVAGDGVSYAAMDITGDGQEDIITADGENGPGPADGGPPFMTGGLIWWQRPANVLTGTWIPHTIDASITDVHNLVLADMSGDGQDEILAFEQDQSPQGRLMIIYNEGGTGQNWLEQTIASDSDPAAGGGEGGHNEDVGDATGDGFLDILTSPHGFYTGVNPISLFVNDIPSDGIVTPAVTSDPVSQTVNAGGSVTFTVAANGTGPLVFQWEDNGLDIPGANSSSFTIPSANVTDAGVYRCIVGNPAGLIPSAGATLGVIGAVLTPPQDVSSPSAFQTLQVVYSDPSGVNLSSLMKGNLAVSGPLNFLEAPRFLFDTSSNNGQTITATYRVDPPPGNWTIPADGVYTVSLAPNSVSDMDGDFLPSADLGIFHVDIGAPTIAHAGSVAPSLVTGLTASLSILGADDAGQSSLTYSWSVAKAPSGAKTPIISNNGTNAARSTTARFFKAGGYDLRCTITNALDLTVTDLVTFEVAQTATQLKIVPHGALIAEGSTQIYGATEYDQFGHLMDAQPDFIYSILEGPGSIDSRTGIYSAPRTAGHLLIQVKAGRLIGTAGGTVVA